ncbi:uncharacterized protein BXZ73DRAFT_75444 [Epithele typhae]|uniref:uncharacterized protein n=1 Tax=Epithele typhae TaxID=378194 RepID=UPI002007FD87|nr:uncharacterized protein BXZ73DRAFT_75444 [Epithele typhae]KAH9940924.1 hypothetical protein BXZ73DRAFT_75444 [Epithele typhae]
MGRFVRQNGGGRGKGHGNGTNAEETMGETTHPADAAFVLRGADETIRIHMGRCDCLGARLAVVVAGSGSGSGSVAVVPRLASAATTETLSSTSTSASSVEQDKKRRQEIELGVGVGEGSLGMRCPSGRIATWEGGAKEFVLGERRVRLTFRAW